MNVFKKISLKYFNGSSNLNEGEERDIITSRDKVGGIISQENKLNANKRQLILTLLFTQCCKSLQQLIRK